MDWKGRKGEKGGKGRKKGARETYVREERRAYERLGSLFQPRYTAECGEDRGGVVYECGEGAHCEDEVGA